MAVEARRRLDDGPLDHSGPRPRLVGGRCRQCAEIMFPLRSRCTSCSGGEVERLLLPRRGVVWTWTVQGFAPKSPPYVPDSDADEFVPFGVGYVELPGYLRVEARLTESSPERLRIGMDVELVATERAGGPAFAFAPVATATEAP